MKDLCMEFQKNEATPDGKGMHEKGAKADAGKTSTTMVTRSMAAAIWAVCQVGTYGGVKYTRDGWREVEDAETRYREAQERHQAAIDGGEMIAPDTGYPHAAHIAWNALARLQLVCDELGIKAGDPLSAQTLDLMAQRRKPLATPAQESTPTPEPAEPPVERPLTISWRREGCASAPAHRVFYALQVGSGAPPVVQLLEDPNSREALGWVTPTRVRGLVDLADFNCVRVFSRDWGLDAMLRMAEAFSPTGVCLNLAAPVPHWEAWSSLDQLRVAQDLGRECAVCWMPSPCDRPNLDVTVTP